MRTGDLKRHSMSIAYLTGCEMKLGLVKKTTLTGEQIDLYAERGVVHAMNG